MCTEKGQWRVFDRLTEQLYALSQTSDTQVRFEPLYIHSFEVRTPGKKQVLPDYDQLPCGGRRLRRCRQAFGFSQAELAAKAGISLGTYKALEWGRVHQVPMEVMERLAKLLQVPVTDFLDEFNRFLYDGQAARIRAYRESFGMGKKPFAREIGIPVRCLQDWENGRKAVSYQSWERYFKGRA